MALHRRAWLTRPFGEQLREKAQGMPKGAPNLSTAQATHAACPERRFTEPWIKASASALRLVIVLFLSSQLLRTHCFFYERATQAC
eukprot:1157658-Pelagomonas_calceolata.AAC.1